MVVNLNVIDKKIINEVENRIEKNALYLDFVGEDTKTLTHGYHSYPAMMIPQVARTFLEATLKYQSNIKNLYDPFMGSGTSLVEGIVHELNVFGIDINPLSTFMSEVKTHPIEPELLQINIDSLKNSIYSMYDLYKSNKYKIGNLPTFPRIDFWFKPKVIELLQLIKNCILECNNLRIRSFYFAAFSETVRYVSNTRNNEFKLYRMAPDKLETWEPDVIKIFINYLSKNFIGNNALYSELKKQNPDVQPIIDIKKRSSSDIPEAYKHSMDLVITSPPYGDSKTTVAYGQFSRLSLQWLDLKLNDNTQVNQLDNVMLGGKVDKQADIDLILEKLESETLKDIYKKISTIDKKRAREVLQFYADLDKTIKTTATAMKDNSYQFWVIANRTVKTINIPTDIIISELFKKYKVHHIYSFYRHIPNKRMPSKNSPTNKIGNHAVTMSSEIILMLRKQLIS